jgi:hypothetical protein
MRVSARSGSDRRYRANRDSSFKKAVLPFDSRTQAVTRAAIAILVVLLAAWVARDFLMALTWAAVIAITA